MVLMVRRSCHCADSWLHDMALTLIVWLRWRVMVDCCCCCVGQFRGWTPLYIASRNGHLEVCRWLAVECGCDLLVEAEVSVIIKSACSSSGSVLTASTFWDSINILDLRVVNNILCWLLLAIENVISRNNLMRLVFEQGWSSTCLHAASENDHLEVCKCLAAVSCVDAPVKDSVSVNQVVVFVGCQLQLAMRECCGLRIKWLMQLSHGTCCKQGGLTPLYKAADRGYLKLCKWLVTEYGCDASMKSHVSVNNLLLTNDHFTMNFHDLCCEQYGHTPLHGACSGGHLELCKWLGAECGCDATVKSNVSVNKWLITAAWLPCGLLVEYDIHDLCCDSQLVSSLVTPLFMEHAKEAIWSYANGLLTNVAAMHWQRPR